MRYLLFLLAFLLPLSLSAQETSPTLKLAPAVAVTVGPRQVLLSEGELSDKELSNAKSRYAPSRYDEMVASAKRFKMANAIIEASVKQFCQDNGVKVSEEEISDWVKGVRAKGAENRNRDIAKYEGEIKAKEAEIAAAATDPTKLKQLEAEKAKMEQTLAALREAFKMDDQLAQLYPGLGLMFLETWKSRRALINEFGGQVYLSGDSVEPYDAMEALIEKQKKDGIFITKDPYADEALKSFFDRRRTLRAIPAEEGKRRLNEQNW